MNKQQQKIKEAHKNTIPCYQGIIAYIINKKRIMAVAILEVVSAIICYTGMYLRNDIIVIISGLVVVILGLYLLRVAYIVSKDDYLLFLACFPAPVRVGSCIRNFSTS